MDNRILSFISAVILLSSCDGNETQFKDSAPTWVDDISPIVHQNCMPCHRPDGGGPFNLIEYRDVAKRKKMVRYVTSIRYMPPWPADKSYRHYANEQGLTEEQIQKIKDWADAGAPYGDSSIAVIPPKYAVKSHLGEPDLVITMKDSFLIKGTNLDQFVMGKIPFELPNDTFVEAIEFVPGNRNFVHHVNGHLVTYNEEKRKDIYAGQHILEYNQLSKSQEIFEAISLANDDGTYPALTENICNYLPSVVPMIYPEGIGGYKFPKKGAILMNDLHYGPTPKDEWDKSSFNIFFAEKKPERPMQEFYLGTYGVSPVLPDLIIQPGEIKKVHSEYRLKKDISLLTINPHMHLIGKSFKAFAIEPTGDTIPLVSIPKWDFRWQYYYTFEKIQVLKKGTLIHAEGVYDNTKDNPWNPYNPPRVIRDRDDVSMRTTDEMFQLIMMYVDYKDGDENIVLGER